MGDRSRFSPPPSTAEGCLGPAPEGEGPSVEVDGFQTRVVDGRRVPHQRGEGDGDLHTFVVAAP